MDAKDIGSYKAIDILVKLHTKVPFYHLHCQNQGKGNCALYWLIYCTVETQGKGNLLKDTQVKRS